MSRLRVAVLGAGLSGLASARRAEQAGHAVRLFEGGDRAGGVVQTVRRDGWLIEKGPNTLQETTPVAELIRELGLENERIEAGTVARNRFVARHGKLVPLPLSPPAFMAGSFFSLRTKWLIAREFLRRKGAADPESDPSFARLIEDRFGREVLRCVAQPFASGTYAGDAAKLSARYAFPRLWQQAERGSILRGQAAVAKARKAAGAPPTPPLVSFRSGMGTLAAALQRSLSPDCLATNSVVTGLTQAGAAWHLAGTGAIAEPAEFDEVIITLPAKAAAALRVQTSSGSAEPFAFLGAIPHPPVTALFAGFRSEAIKHPLNGFGCLVPAAEQRNILGILFSSSLFPDRAPPGHAALTIMLGGALQPALARLSALEAWAVARADVESLLGITEHPVMLEAVHYPEAIPQYNVGHGQILSAIAKVEQALPGLKLAGSYRGGISVPDRIA
jgi:oxygen-dependent protoporphyrinogen oxidase